MDEFDAATLAQFQNGRFKGMAECHDIVWDLLNRFSQSASDIWSVYYNGKLTPEKNRIAQEMTLISDFVETLRDSFQDHYDMKIDRLKAETEETDEQADPIGY